MKYKKLDSGRKLVLIFLIIFGISALVHGILIAEKGDLDYSVAILNQSLQPIPINDSRIEFVTDSHILTVSAFFNTTDTFSADKPFDIIMNASSDDVSAYDEVAVLPLDAGGNMTLLKNHNQTQIIVDYDNKTGHLIKLYPNSKTNSFYGVFKKMRLTSEGDLIFMAIPYKSGTIVQEIPLFPNHPVKIYPITAQYQVDTDRNIQKQNIESAKSNLHVEGLTYVIIGLVFIGLFIEAIIHRYITDYGKDYFYEPQLPKYKIKDRIKNFVKRHS